MADKNVSETVKLFSSEVTTRFGKTFGNAVWVEMYRRVDKDGGIPEVGVVSVYEKFGSRSEFKLFLLGFMGGTLGDMQ